jgi:transposase
MKTTDYISYAERGKARKNFVRKNMDTMTVEEMAEATGTTTTTVRDYIARINKTGKYAEQPKVEKPSKYDTWECRKPKKYLSDNFVGIF